MKIVDDNNRSEYQPKPEDRNDDKPKNQLIKSIPPKYFLYLAIFVALSTGYYFAFSERTYADCILHNMKEAKTNDIATAIKSACREKYGY